MKKLHELFLILAASVAFGGGACAQTALLSSATPAAFSLIHGSYGSGSIVSVAGQPFTQAWQVNVTSAAPSAQSVVLSAGTGTAVAAGDAIVATFYYRRTDTASDEINISAHFEQAVSPGADSVSIPLRGRQQWRQVSIPFIANAAYAAGGARFYFALSAQIQSLQISGVTLTDYGQKSLFGTGIVDITSLCSFSGTAAGTTFGTDASVAASNPFFTSASHIAVLSDPHQDSVVKLSAAIPHAIASGDTLVAVFWVRDADGTPKNALIATCLQTVAAPTATPYNSTPILVDNNWKQEIVPFPAPASYAANTMQFLVKFSGQVQTIEVGGIQLLDLGAPPAAPLAASLNSTLNDYPGRLLADAWRADADARIAAIRKGNFTLSVTDGSGGGLGSVSVAAAMQKHLFGFGTAIEAKEVTTVTGTDADTYRANLKANFNKVVFENEMKWTYWEQANDPKLVQNTIDWLRTNAIFNIRGHNLVWPSWGYSPTDLPGLSVPALTARILAHIDAETGYFKVKNNMQDWDVVNEPYINHAIMDKLNGISSGRGTVAQDATQIATWYVRAAADDAFPNTFLNDNGVVEDPLHLNTDREDYNYNLLANLIADGAPVDGFGFESHFTAATPPLVAKAIFDRFAALGVREEVTEFDQNVPDTLLQADFLSDYLTLVFSEPNFDSFLMWGFWDTLHWHNNAPLYTPTWSLKPSGEAWKGLVYGKWWTNATATTGGSGTATINGFLGRYALTASSGGITKVYYANLPSPAGATLNLKLGGSAGTSHVWLYEPATSVRYSPFVVGSDANAYGGSYISSPTANLSNATTGLDRMDMEATGTVKIWLRVATPDAADGSFWLSADGETYHNFTIPGGTAWHWVLWKQAAFAAGTTHLVSVAASAANTKLNQVLVTDDLSFTP